MSSLSFTQGDKEPAEARSDVATLFGSERGRLLGLLASLGPNDWLRSTPCPDWNVLDLCCHLLGDDLSWLARQRDNHYGIPAPPTLDELGFAAWLDELQIQWVKAARRLSPRLILDLLAWSGPQMTEALSSQDASAMTASVSWAGPGPAPVWLDQLRELSEHWIHRQQLLQAIGRPSDLRADLAGPVLDGLRWAYPYRLSAIAGHVGDTVKIAITGETERTWCLVRDPDGWHYASNPTPHSVAALDMTAEEAWRLLTNNLPAEQQALLRGSGDQDVLTVLRHTRAIIGAVK